MADRKLIVQIVGDNSSLTRAFRDSSRDAKRFSVGFGTILKSAVVFSAVERGIDAVSGAIRSGIGEWSEQQKVAAQTTAAIKSTGAVAHVTAGQVSSLAEDIARLTGIDDELIQSGENLLLTFKNVRNEVGAGNQIFDRATRAAVDLSVAGFGSLDSTAKQLGKALNDPVRGMTALSRAGVTFTQRQKNTIKSLVQSGRTLEAQRLILKEVESQVGGSGKALGETLPGQLNRLRETARNVFGDFIALATPALTGVLDQVNTFVDRLSEARTVRAKLNVIFDFGRSLVVQGRELAERARIEIVNALEHVDWAEVGRAVGRGIASTLDQIAAFLRTVDWGKVGSAIVRGIINFLKGVDWVKLFKSIVRLWVAALVAQAKLLLGAGRELGEALMAGIGEGIDQAKDFLIRKLLQFVNRLLGVTGFLGRFDPFKGLREDVQERLAGMSSEPQRLRRRLQTAPRVGREGTAGASLGGVSQGGVVVAGDINVTVDGGNPDAVMRAIQNKVKKRSATRTGRRRGTRSGLD